MTMTTAELNTLTEQQLLETARSIQREQHLLISGRTNPQRFGQLERQLETIWKRVDAIRGANLGTPLARLRWMKTCGHCGGTHPGDRSCGCFDNGGQ
jgi:hypothetical protein